MSLKICKWDKSKSMRLTYMVIIILMVGLFCAVYGVNVLNPTYTDWLLNGEDLTQHYLGWVGYRLGEWRFPIGLTDYLAYPTETSVVYTDSIPLFAVFFKLLSPILPADFQYFGLWGLMCMILQGILAAQIIRKYTNNRILIVLTSLLLTAVPAMHMRMYTHTALAGHWILLYALKPLFLFNEYDDKKRLYLHVAINGVLAMFIHAYFVLMCGIILVGVCILDVLRSRKLKKSILLVGIYIVSAAVIFGVLGGFTGGGIPGDSGLGIYSANINALWNSQNLSAFLPSLGTYGNGQGEGFAYLGAGCLLLAAIVLITLLVSKENKKLLFLYWKESVAYACVAFIATVVALSPKITWGSHLLVDVPWPSFIIRLWNIFRATGRIMWIVDYVVILTVCILIFKLLNRKGVIVCIILCVCLQYYDNSVIFAHKHALFSTVTAQKLMPMESEVWDEIGQENVIQNIVLTNRRGPAELYAFGNWALENQKTVNRFWFARIMDEEQSNKYADSLLENENESEAFVFTKENALRCLQHDLNYYDADGYILGCKTDFATVDKLQWEDFAENYFVNEYIFKDNQYLMNGEDIEGTRYLYTDGLSYGPYCYVPAGEYEIILEGKNLTDCILNISSGVGTVIHEYMVKEAEDGYICVSLSTEDDIENLEVVVQNISDQTIELELLQIRVLSVKE